LEGFVLSILKLIVDAIATCWARSCCCASGCRRSACGRRRRWRSSLSVVGLAGASVAPHRARGGRYDWASLIGAFLIVLAATSVLFLPAIAADGGC
jgi:hypothetical protein